MAQVLRSEPSGSARLARSRTFELMPATAREVCECSGQLAHLLHLCGVPVTAALMLESPSSEWGMARKLRHLLAEAPLQLCSKPASTGLHPKPASGHSSCGSAHLESPLRRSL